MPTPVFHLAHPITDRAALLELNTEYMTWVVDGLERGVDGHSLRQGRF